MPVDEGTASDELPEQEVPEETEEEKYSDNLFVIEPEPDLEAEIEEEYEGLSEPQADPDSFIIDYRKRTIVPT